VGWLVDAVSFAAGMGWEILWALILGFTLSAVVQAVVGKEQMRRLLPDDSPRSMAIGTGLGAASSSCSYAAVALARSLFRKGADFTASMAFQFASTNLVFELGIIMWIVLGWEFAAGEFLGGPLMILVMWLLFRRFLTPRLRESARRHAERGALGRMEGHAEMDMSVAERGPLRKRLFSGPGYTSVSGYFVMDWAAVWVDIVAGLLIAGGLAAWVPDSFRQGLFLEHHGWVAQLWGPLIGPIVAVLSFVCSIGNVPLVAVLWNGGISFGGVLSFIFADLLVLPVIDIYRKYYGWRVTGFLVATFYAAIVLAGWVIDLVFQGLGWVPAERDAAVEMASITWNYTTVLNIVFLALAAALLIRFVRTGGLPMLRMMSRPMGRGEEHHQEGGPHGAARA
jgi:uncharacterized protein